MKLDQCEVFVVGNPPPRRGGRYFILVRLTTRCGVTGIGEIYSATFSPNVVKIMAQDVFDRHFHAQDPHRIEWLWRKTYSAGFTQRPDASLVGILSGLEMACWDIVGKAANQPVHKLLGGPCRDQIRVYTYLYPDNADAHAALPSPSIYDDPDLAAERALDYLGQGFTALKFDPAGAYTMFDGHQPRMADLDRSELFCKRLREAVGDKADLLFGTHGQFTTSGAKRMARRIEPYEPLWFEEPTPPEMPEQMAEVARSTSVPIATGERLVTKYEFQRVLTCGAASILQPALGRVGGLLEARKIAAMAETHYAQMAPHLYCGPVEALANAQLSASIPNFLIMESIEQMGGFHAELLTKPMQVENGYLIPSQEPGLGSELNDDVIAAHIYEGPDLHLMMLEDEL